jgi:hypothetical protein
MQTLKNEASEALRFISRAQKKITQAEKFNLFPHAQDLDFHLRKRILTKQGKCKC